MTDKLLPIGTRVKRTESGIKNWGICYNNPEEKVEGTIYKYYERPEKGFVYRVKWDNGSHNAYYKTDIEEITRTSQNTTIKLTRKMIGEPQSDGSLLITTDQKVSGGGSRNILTWALLASKKGFLKIVLSSLSDDKAVVDNIQKSVDNANELLKHLGVTVTYK